MGIPKFYRYISERWPTISNLVNGSIVPEFDNLYLDMNAIIHNCTHANDDDPTKRMTEQEMMIGIFNYIEHLFSIAKPQRVFYMAIDGVAPRAKMNQQRSRRFKSAKEAQEARQKALHNGADMPASAPFDSNCITPGTEFMANLTVHLKHFINRKITEDSSWQNIEIILSGHEVPGEGEHKIMNYLRSLRSTPGYNPNTRHCLYGLDADLIMLGLSTHEPHFALLREEVLFGRQQQSNELSEKRFSLLHLSLVREYMQLEFIDVLEENFDFERILDDFILINFFIGNDFLPEVPMLLINDGALPVIFHTYMQYLLQTRDYLTSNGVINFANVQLWLKQLSVHQTQKFEEQSQDAEWYNNELADLKLDDTVILTQHEKNLVRSVKPFVLGAASEENLDDYSYTLPSAMTARDTQLLGLLASQVCVRVVDNEQPDGSIKSEMVVDTSKYPVDDAGKHVWLKETRKIFKVYESATIDTERNTQEEIYSKKLVSWRNQYYKKKFQVSQDDERVKNAARNYLEGLQWVLSYYYRGCPSWSWYYHEHYAPMTSDLFENINPDFKVEFGPSTPFKPFEQLMGVLPDRSASLVPPAYRDLMSSEASPIIDFYPHDFKTDKNGKKHDWESVVLIPFIDEVRLQDALAKRESLLSPAEKARNGRGTDLSFSYDPNANSTFRSQAEYLNDIHGCKCVSAPINPHSLNPEKIVYGILEDARVGASTLAGFPSLDTLNYSFEIRHAGVRVFERESLVDSVCLTINSAFTEQTFEEIAHGLVGSVGYVGYPFLQEAKIVAVSEGNMVHDGTKSFPFSNDKLRNTCQKEGEAAIKDYEKTKAITFKKSHIFVHCNRLRGLERTPEGHYRKVYDDDEANKVIYPIELLVRDVIAEDERFLERQAGPIEEEFPVGIRPIVLLSKTYGSEANVTGYSDGKLNIEVNGISEQVQSYPSEVAKKQVQSEHYMSGGEVAKKLQINTLWFYQLTSRALFSWDGKMFNIGLVLKKPAQNLKALGYTRKQGTFWTFSEKAKELVATYLREFKQPLQLLGELTAKKNGNGIVDVKKVLAESKHTAGGEFLETLQKMSEWVKIRMDEISYGDVSVECLSKESVVLIEEWSREIASKRTEIVPAIINNVHRSALMTVEMAQHRLSQQHFYLGDRVMFALDFGKVPQYSRGIVVGKKQAGISLSIEVIFDKEFDAGSSLDGRVRSKRGLTVDSGSLLNITTKELAYDRSADFIPAETLPQYARRNHTATRGDKGFGRGSGRGGRGGKYVPAPAHNRQSAWKNLEKQNEQFVPRGANVNQAQPQRSVQGQIPQMPPQSIPQTVPISQQGAPESTPQGEAAQNESQQLLSMIKGNPASVDRRQQEKERNPKNEKKQKKGKMQGSPPKQQPPAQKPQPQQPQPATSNPLAALQAELGISQPHASAPAPAPVPQAPQQPKAPQASQAPQELFPPDSFEFQAFQRNANKKDSESLLKLLQGNN